MGARRFKGQGLTRARVERQPLFVRCTPESQVRSKTLRWREMDSNFRFPDAPSGRSAEARTFSSDREFAPLAWRDRDFEPPAPSRVDLCVRARTVSGT